MALVGAVGAASMQVMKGPVRAMSEVTKRTIAENNMIASTKLAIISASAQTPTGDCDSDGFIEPIEPDDPLTGAYPPGGGYLPSTIGAALADPWSTRFGYCSWDHGTDVAKCGGTKPLLLAGGPVDNQYAIAVISAGPDHVFQTNCNAYVDTTPADDQPDVALITKGAGSDDIVLGYTYAEANNIGGGLWQLKDGDNSKATIGKDIEVRNAADTETIFGLDRATGMAEFMALKTDNIYAKSTPNGTIQVQDLFRLKGYANLAAPSGGGGGGGGSDNLGNHIATMNLKLFHTAGGAGISGSEADPQVGTLTNTKWCTTDGTDIDCTTNSPVGTLTNDKWCRSDGTQVICDQDAPGGGGVDRQTFTASGTWTKPTSGNFVKIECIGGGGGGSRVHNTYGNGGGGGGYNFTEILFIDAPASAAVTIGAGGAGCNTNNCSGVVGGNTTFGAILTAYGGGAGGASWTGGGGGGMKGAGSNSSSVGGAGYEGSNTASPDGVTRGGNGYFTDGYSSYPAGNSFYGGGGGGGANGNSSVYTRGGGSAYGGGGGGAVRYNNIQDGVGGSSGAGGNGGNALASGTAPGGGGGALGGAGAAGRCVVTTW